VSLPVTVAFPTLGCRLNQVDSQEMAALMETRGFRAVAAESPAEIYVVNTCTVTGRADLSDRQLVRRVRREHPEALVVVTGCYAQTDPEAVARIGGVDLVIGNGEKHRLPELLADLLAGGKVLARCVGRMEFGARALGNRSILCDPSKPENLNLINQKIKFRDFWMPFTPSILQERADDYLINPKKLQASFMTIAFDSTPRARKDIRAAIHPADFTVRPQLVTRKLNPGYYELIKAFESRTGVGALLNTSLNLHGDPIVCNVADAIKTLVESGLDGVILPGVLILRRANNPGP